MAAPGGTGPIGPFPPGVDRDEYDKLRRRVLWSLPYGLYVLGSRHGERRNLMTLSFCSQVSFDPKLIGVGIEKTAITHELVSASGLFTLNTIDREDRSVVRKLAKPAEIDEAARTASGFPFHDAAVTGAPVLDAAVAVVECEVRNPVDCGGHTFFIAEVLNAAFQRPEDTPVLRMEDTRMNYGG